MKKSPRIFDEVKANRIRGLLLSKGVSTDHIELLKRKKVININKRLYDYTIEEITDFKDVPVSKIVSTQRTGLPLRSWWETIFDSNINNNLNSWNNITNEFKKVGTVGEFHQYLYEGFPPIEAIDYYPELDLYEVTEGHHRTLWAILTGMPTIKAKSMTIHKINNKKCLERKTFLKEVSLLRKKLTKYNGLINNLISQMNLNNDGNMINYGSTFICMYSPYKKDTFITSYHGKWDLKANEDCLNTNKYGYKRLAAIAKEHRKYRYFPLSVKSKIASIRYFFKPEDHCEILNNLYKNNWNPKIK